MSTFFISCPFLTVTLYILEKVRQLISNLPKILRQFMNGKLIIITAPSGSGKSTLINILLQKYPQLQFSISACTRAPRGKEVDGKDYYFISTEAFKDMIEQNAFIEWEMVYEGLYYGTPKAELQRIWQQKGIPLIDIDVKGALNLKKMFGDQLKTIFIQVPSIEELATRLRKRGTDSEEAIQKRLAKAQEELAYASAFDTIIVNDNLEIASQHIAEEVDAFINIH